MIGLARLDIPRVGLPVIWWSQGHKERTAATALGLIVALLLASSARGNSRRADADQPQQSAQPA